VSKQYAGVCIGGPMAGQAAVASTPTLKAEVRPPLKTMLEESLREPESSMDVIEHTTVIYNWLHTGGLGLWIVSGMNMNDAITAMVKAYVEQQTAKRIKR
jgi:hypothetical protein